MSAPTGQAPLSRRGLLTAAGAVLLLAAGSTLTVAAASGAFDTTSSPSSGYGLRGGTSCTAPALPGATVSVQLADMRSMTGRPGSHGGMMGGSDRGGGMMQQSDWRYFQRGTMRVLPSANSVPAGVVSLKVTNTGYLTHELVVLPLPAGQQAGTRAVDSDGTVAETGSLGEASASCAAGEGDGIIAGSTGWVTLHLPAGRYELVCNLHGHYTAGMYTELDVH
jgi:uncharacterized cupredoxin-like copper-binding protein